jgi:hypothetical protein
MTINGINGLSSYLASQLANTKDNPCFIALKIDNETDFEILKTVLNGAADKYVYLDFSGSTITTIPKNAFNTGCPSYRGCTTLAGITVSDTVTNIEDRAFQGCVNLESVTIPASVTRIGSLAFFNCARLVSITIPDSVTNIGDYAFESCDALTSVYIPASVTDIGQSVFSNCNYLTAIDVDASSSRYVTENGVLYSKDKTVLIAYPAGKPVSSFTIPDEVTSIVEEAFFCCSNLSAINVTTKNNAYSAEDGVLYTKDKTLLHTYPAGKPGSSFIIPTSVTAIGDCAFSGCNSLTDVIIPNSVTSIGSSAFTGCSSLKSIIIPNSVSNIGFGALNSCSSLTSVTFEGTVPSTMFYPAFFGNLRAKFYSADPVNGTPGTYTRPSGSSEWTKQYLG